MTDYKYFMHVSFRTPHSNTTSHGLKALRGQDELQFDFPYVVRDAEFMNLLSNGDIKIGEVVAIANFKSTKIGGNYVMEDLEGVLLQEVWKKNKKMSDAYDSLVEQFDALEKNSKMVKKIKVSTLMADVAAHHRCPTIEDDGFYVDPDLWIYLVRNVVTSRNTLLFGPTGSGKTEIMKFLAGTVNKPLKIHDMGGMQDGVVGLIGQLKMDGLGTKFDWSPFVQHIQEANMVVFDEINRAPSNTGNILLPLTDGRRCLPTTLAGSELKEEIKVHDKCAFFATANLGGEYSGTQVLDRALRGRFLVAEIPYMPEDKEVSLLMKRCEIPRNYAEAVAKISNIIRNQYFEGGLSDSVGHRETLEIGHLIKDGFAAVKAMEFVMLPLFQGNDVKGERSIVKSIITSR
jgi:nitric oxide reductase NorQ protein